MHYISYVIHVQSSVFLHLGYAALPTEWKETKAGVLPYSSLA